MGTIRVELKNISKAFSGVRALKDVSLRAYTGECLGLVGENGAGKSTLMKVLSGVWPSGSFQGEIQLDGKTVHFQSPKDALDSGIAIIHQELSLFEELSVAENIFIRDLPRSGLTIRWDEMFSKAEELLSRLRIQLDPASIVSSLSVGQKQLVEIARSFTKPVKVLIFDEPTSALSEAETKHLFERIEEIRSQGVACLYISHKFEEIERLCDRVTVLRDGECVKHFDSRERSSTELIEAMVGRKIENVFPQKRPPDPSRSVILSVKNLSYVDRRQGKPILSDISFDVRKSEVFGIAGLMGSRRTELLLSLFGSLDAVKVSGEIEVDGQILNTSSPRDSIRAGLALVTEDRKLNGLVLERSVQENMTLPVLKQLSQFSKISQKKESEIVDYYTRILRIKTASAQTLVRHLSGGNQQKVILGRWLSSKPKILLLDEPTRGIDVMAKAEIYYLIRDLVDQGLTLILVSSELPEIVSLADRVLVMKQGLNQGILEGSSISQTAIMERAVAA